MNIRTFDSPEAWQGPGVWLRGRDYTNVLTIGDGQFSGQGVLLAKECTGKELDDAEFVKRLDTEAPATLEHEGMSELQKRHGAVIPDGRYIISLRVGVYDPKTPGSDDANSEL